MQASKVVIPKVVIRTNGNGKRRVLPSKIQCIVSNRVVGEEEQYLIRWKTDTETSTPPLSWHAIGELVRCLDEVQIYIETRAQPKRDYPRKRKSPDNEAERRPSPFDRHLHPESVTRLASRACSPAISSTAPSSIEVYNGIIDANEDGCMFSRPASGEGIISMDISRVFEPGMILAALHAKIVTSLRYIRAEYIRRLDKLPGHRIHIYNTVDASTPSLSFKYVSEYVLSEGIYKVAKDGQPGCQKCSPHMGRDIGCEYTKVCDCLEYAAVDEQRITDPAMRKAFAKYKMDGKNAMGFPKKFPYYAGDVRIQKAGCLVPFYLNSRHPIYECNDNCRCGPKCRNRNVQFGREVEVEIFKTKSGRGWGLRCKEDLHEGQFIDTYRGEVITDAEATKREEESSKTKASYLYSLDKFAATEGIKQEDLYVVDGEFMGGPTKFMNHCCQPNCRQYTVSYNKNDARLYDIAFFTCKFVPAGEELTFDYLDKDDSEPIDEPGEDAISCLCGAAECRKWLWT